MKKLLNPVIITLIFFIFVQLFSFLLLMMIKTKNDQQLKQQIQQNPHIDTNIADADVVIEHQILNDK